MAVERVSGNVALLSFTLSAVANIIGLAKRLVHGSSDLGDLSLSPSSSCRFFDYHRVT